MLPSFRVVHFIAENLCLRYHADSVPACSCTHKSLQVWASVMHALHKWHLLGSKHRVLGCPGTRNQPLYPPPLESLTPPPHLGGGLGSPGWGRGGFCALKFSELGPENPQKNRACGAKKRHFWHFQSAWRRCAPKKSRLRRDFFTFC